MPGQIPTEEEVLSYFQKFSNWGRWGDDDELGTPNLITPEKTKRALATVQEGTSVSLARTVMFEPSLDAPARPSISWWKAARAGPAATRSATVPTPQPSTISG